MTHDEPNPMKTAAKPKRRWFQFGLKSLFVLPVIVGLPLALYLYWDDWKDYRPPYQQYDYERYDAAFDDFVADLQSGRLAHAYDSTSVRFKKQMSRSQFESLIGTHPALQHKRHRPTRSSLHVSFDVMPLRNWSRHDFTVQGSDDRIIHLCVWVVMDDSIFRRRPPPPAVEEIQIRVFNEAGFSQRHSLPHLRPSWEQE